MRKILSLFFVVILSTCALFMLSLTAHADDSAVITSEGEILPTASGTCGENVTWAYYEETGLLEINGSGDMQGYASIQVPWYAYKNKIKKLSITKDVTSIGDLAFYDCKSITSVSFEENSQLTSIGDYAFRECTSLTSIIVPDGVTRIGFYSFYGCTSLGNISIPFVGEKKVGTNNTHFGYIFGASSYSKNYDYVPASLKTVTITKDFAITSYAFWGCKSLTNIAIPDSVTRIDKSAFNGCTSLTSMILPDCVTNIGDYAFRSCESLTSLIIPNDVSSIGSYAFDSCTSLMSVSFEENSQLTSIGDYAFNGCTSLASVIVPDGVTSIGSYAFNGCTSLTNAKIPDSVTSIGTTAFRNYYGFTITGYYNTAAYTFAQRNSIHFNALPCKICLYNRETVQDLYLKSDATCEQSAAYYKHCLCGNISSTDIFYYGEPHNYVDKANEIYIKEAATCTSVAIYYKSCRDCGIAHTTKTFEGEIILPHEYIDFLDEEYLKSAATIYSPAIYYKSCKSCGLKSNDTFDHGEPLEAYHVVYNANGGQGAPATQAQSVGITLTLSNEKPTKNGYKFIGWNTLTHGETIYSPGENYTHNENITLYAMWLPNCSGCNGAGGFTQGE